MNCERCGEPIHAERLELHPKATWCASCASKVQRVIRQHLPVDDPRERREGSPPGLRKPENLQDGD
jgi:hypothetical protein